MIYNNIRNILWEGMYILMKMKILGIILIICCFLSGCQKGKPNGDKVVATIGDAQITLSEFNFYLDSVKQQMQGTELSSDEDWQTKDINGKKAIDVAKERALNIAGTNIAYIKLYELLGYEIDDAAKEQIAKTKDDIVIYTGYTEKELNGYLNKLKNIPNLILKFGRFIPNNIAHYDEILGVELASDNQYAIKL